MAHHSGIHPNTWSEQRMVMNFHPWRWGLYFFHPLTRRLWNFSFINVKVMWSLSTSKQKVISGNQLEDIGYWGYKTFHPSTWDYRVAFKSLIRRLCVVTQLEDNGYQSYETFHPNFSLTHSRVRSLTFRLLNRRFCLVTNSKMLVTKVMKIFIQVFH